MVPAPKFINSPYFVSEVDNWHLKEGAPPEVVKEFEEFMQRQKEAEDDGVSL